VVGPSFSVVEPSFSVVEPVETDDFPEP